MINFSSIGTIIALTVFVLVVVLIVVSKLPVLIGCLIAALALARILP